MTEQIGLRTNSGASLALRGVDATARIAGLLATTTLVQQYENATDTNLEVAYSFPLPVDAVLLVFTVCIGERRYCGEVVPRRQAEQKYEQAVESGNSAFRLQEVSKGLYSATLGNVLAGERVRIELEYAEPLSWDGKNIRYRLPTTLAPRYGKPRKFAPWQEPRTSLEAQYALKVSVELRGELAKASVTSPSHDIQLAAEVGCLKVLAAEGASLDRDFILDVRGDELQSLGAAASALDTHVAMVTFMPPAVASDTGRDTVIVLDCSGSMMGDSIRLAKEGVQFAIGHLTPADRFGLIGFGSTYTELSPALQSADSRSVQRARRFVSDLGEMGGTELANALLAALAYAQDRPFDILLLTDGEAWNLEDVTEKANAVSARIFTIGIGSAVAEDTVRMLADQTGGACELVSPNEDMSARIERHFNRMHQPRIQDVTVAWPATPLWESRPTRASFAGDAFTVFAAFPSEVAGTVTANLSFTEGEHVTSTAIRLDSVQNMDTEIVRVAAAARMAVLNETEQQEWAVRYQLVTDETDYIVTLARTADERPQDLPELHVVPQMHPAGWGGFGTVRSSAAVHGLTCESTAFTVAECDTAMYSPSTALGPDLDIPAVIRCRPRPVRTAATHRQAIPTTLGEFLARVKRRAQRRILAGLPTTRAELVKLDCPVELLAVLDEALQTGQDEIAAVVTLYSALAHHACASILGEQFVAATNKLLAATEVAPHLQLRFAEQLDALWSEDHAQHSQRSQYDIPAFLRRDAD
ncbi:VIT and VWA domain-containing protein [Aromatoleum toluolicum]|nr:VIT domain-containing protein [Aromatoleum toluolicum]NMF96158.2 VIT and VWA domain-containing protein [Aromatoleum toluolicum]